MHVAHRSNDDRSSEASSARSSASGNDSLPGSAASSPCESPQPTASKWGDGDHGAAMAHPCRYFVMKAANNKMLQTAEQRGIWGTTSSNEKKIAGAFTVCNLSASITHCASVATHLVRQVDFFIYRPK